MDAAPADDATLLDAGAFGDWLPVIDEAVRGRGEAEVPCGTCTACCRSSQFVHIGPDETDTLAHIPAALRFPAPRLPRGHVLLGYDEHGRCPMLVDDGCSIYAHRPRACRTYDCRVFTATGIAPDPAQPDIGARVRRWRFRYDRAGETEAHRAITAAVRWLRAHADQLGEDAPRTSTQLAVLAIRARRAFEATDEPDPDAVQRALTAQ